MSRYYYYYFIFIFLHILVYTASLFGSYAINKYHIGRETAGGWRLYVQVWICAAATSCAATAFLMLPRYQIQSGTLRLNLEVN